MKHIKPQEVSMYIRMNISLLHSTYQKLYKDFFFKPGQKE